MSENIKLKVTPDNLLARLKINERIHEVSDVEPYKGEYEVVPKPYETTTLATAGKKMAENVKVLEIPYSQVSNEAGGNTITIGGTELWNRISTR